ncbi:hypothetical protein M409DRAFT_62979 [Zasmidium cellare ATCC 36951]|uniref:Zn(2)-C6 fungal-type domain-containing protein n=1 Tax=Zasmidium cellare ATCC 36951 TaxID=1080233 RepID=A0A6A6D292_ZASCE|nr:uncharacterized protein M409DRAFT_62979 [Zasmidium cellare ATCC 36951]KAF2172219.1 hypothetical protein M409DRAFT_62979 [Zasmidium cellare ATCC 36951]
MGGDSPAQPSPTPRTKLACRQCQKRKIKCDRALPCNHCRQSGLSCSQGIRKRRSTVESHALEHRNTELRDRLDRLESMVVNMQGQPANGSIIEEIRPKNVRSPGVQVAAANRYVASGFWTSLAGEVQALREVLEEDEHDSSEETSEMTSPSSGVLSSVAHTPGQPPGSFDFIMCHPGRIYEVPGALPELHAEMQTVLFDVYVNYIDACWKVFHVPTVSAFVQEGRPYLDHDAAAPCNRALKAAIHFGGISQMTDKDCQAKFGQPRADLVNYFRRIAEAALVQADLLNTKSLAALQAFDVYVTTTRKHDASHRSWALFGLLVRLAQALNVDRESPYESFFMQQLRRRLWHHILVLDSFFAFDRGSEITIRPGSWQRPLPVNLNDEDLVEYSTASTVEIGRRQPTNMNFALVIEELYIIGDRFEVLHPSVEPDTWQRRLELTKMHNENVQEKYTQHCDPKIPLQRLTMKISRIIQSLNLLNCVRSFQRPFPSQGAPADAPWVLELAVDVLRKTEDLWSDSELDKWSRLPWVQWHPLAVALAGLCAIRKTPLAEESWTVVDRFMERSAAILCVISTRNPRS